MLLDDLSGRAYLLKGGVSMSSAPFAYGKNTRLDECLSILLRVTHLLRSLKIKNLPTLHLFHGATAFRLRLQLVNGMIWQFHALPKK